VQTVGTTGAQARNEPGQEPSRQWAQETEALSSIEATLQNAFDSFVRFSSQAGVSQAFASETPTGARPEGPRQQATPAPSQVAARPMQERLQALEAKVQQLSTEADAQVPLSVRRLELPVSREMNATLILYATTAGWPVRTMVIDVSQEP
jgi:hypothetical protein